MNSKKVLGIYVIAILFLQTTQSVSQTVVVDTTKETTLLDKKATIATGNLLREGEGFKELFQRQSDLVDSLRVESDGYRAEADTLRFSNKLYKQAIKEKENQLKLTNEKHDISEQLFTAELKNQKKKKWSWGFKGFTLGAVLTTLAFVFLKI